MFAYDLPVTSLSPMTFDQFSNMLSRSAVLEQIESSSFTIFRVNDPQAGVVVAIVGVAGDVLFHRQG